MQFHEPSPAGGLYNSKNKESINKPNAVLSYTTVNNVLKLFFRELVCMYVCLHDASETVGCLEKYCLSSRWFKWLNCQEKMSTLEQ